MKLSPPPFPASVIGILSGREVIGDALIKLPFLRALRAAWPQAKIHWITSQGSTAYSDALRETVRPLIDIIHEQPAWLDGTDIDGPAPFFDLLIDTRGKWKSTLQARLRLPHKLFIAPAFRYLLSDRRPALWTPRRVHLVDRLLQMVELATGTLPSTTGRLPVAPELLARARRVLPEGQIYVGFAPGAGNPIKKWPVERFEKLAQMQVRMNRVPVFLLGPQEMDLYDRLFLAVPEAVFPLQAREIWGTSQPNVEQTLAIAHELTIAVTNDSGTSHMLAAVDCPLVSLFGPTEAAKFAPKVSHGAIVEAQSYGGPEMDKIPVEAVAEVLHRLLLAAGRL